jgi:hypothetical protein
MTIESTRAKSTSKTNMQDQGAQTRPEQIVVPSLRLAWAGLALLRKAIARSPIRRPRPNLEARLADWQQTRHAPDIDTVILDWIVSHARGSSLPTLH